MGLRATDNEGATDIDIRQLTVVAAPDPDLDDDGTLNESDCEPNDPAIHPGAADPLEAPYTDSNCDGVDGVASEAIFVSPDGTDSAGAGTTLSNPVATINFALGRAQATGRSKIFIAGGTYEEVISVANGVSMFGGFAPGRRGMGAISRESDDDPEPDSVIQRRHRPPGGEHQHGPHGCSCCGWSRDQRPPRAARATGSARPTALPSRSTR